MTLEQAKMLTEKGLFCRDGNNDNILMEKLLSVAHMILSEKTEETRDRVFEFNLEDGKYAFSDLYFSSDNYSNIGCEEKGWCWSTVTGPKDISEFYYCAEFEKDPDIFATAYIFYVGLFLADTSDGHEQVQRLLKCADAKALCKMCDEVAAGNGFDFNSEAIVDEMLMKRDCYEAETQIQPLKKTALITLILGGWYMHLYLHHKTSVMGLEHRKMFDDCLMRLDGGEEIDGEEYFDYFFSELEDCIECSEEGMKYFLEYYLYVFFSFRENERGKTPTLYCFKSQPMKEYKDLKAKYPEHELVKIIDKVIPLLEDPAHMLGKESVFEGDLGSGECCMEHGYTSQEYVCCYLYFESFFWDHDDYVRYDWTFSIARECFMVLIEEFKKEVSNLEECA